MVHREDVVDRLTAQATDVNEVLSRRHIGWQENSFAKLPVDGLTVIVGLLKDRQQNDDITLVQDFRLGPFDAIAKQIPF